MRDGKKGLYDPAFEHDSCGFGVIANIDGNASAWLVDQAFVTLARMSHRGGIGADGITGDGCGMLLYRPTAWLRALAADAGINPGHLFASGHVFLDPDDIARAADAQAELECQLIGAGLHIAGWRDVPVDATACGPLGASGQPRIRQIFVDAPPAMTEAAFERVLFRARRLAEKARAEDERF
jgi:glutamate synthase (NADPH/NADH) large chain